MAILTEDARRTVMDRLASIERRLCSLQDGREKDIDHRARLQSRVDALESTVAGLVDSDRKQGDLNNAVFGRVNNIEDRQHGRAVNFDRRIEALEEQVAATNPRTPSPEFIDAVRSEQAQRRTRRVRPGDLPTGAKGRVHVGATVVGLQLLSYGNAMTLDTGDGTEIVVKGALASQLASRVFKGDRVTIRIDL